MKKFLFTLFIRTASKQELIVGQRTIDAKNYDQAESIFNKMDLNFHHFATVKKLKND